LLCAWIRGGAGTLCPGVVVARCASQGDFVEEVLLFANSIAGRGRGGAIADRLVEALSMEGYGVRRFLEAPGSIPLERIRAEAPARCAIVIGGDGTLRNVAERLLLALEPDRFPPLLVVPLGTANLMAKHLGIDWYRGAAAAQIIAAIGKRKIVHLDASRANGQLFLLMAGAGLDGHVIHELDRVRSGPIDLSSYVLPVALAMKNYAFVPITVTVDGRRIFGPARGMVFIANAPEYGIGFPVVPQAKSDDGLLDVCVLPCRDRGELLRLALTAAAGEHFEVEGARYLTGTQIGVTAEEAVPVQIDGEAGGFTPLEVELLPVKVPFIVP
jgi:diacylglycerol kinase (ATP)